MLRELMTVGNQTIEESKKEQQEKEIMKKIISMAIIALGIVGILSGGAFAGEAGNHYVNGVEGLKAASLPPPGFYYRMYNVLYTADALTDDNGDEIDAVNFDVSVFANVHRLIWMSNYRAYA